MSAQNHFELFGLPRRHALDLAALEKQYRDLSLKLHPDRAAGAGPKERRIALEQTTQLNEAFKTLKDPTRRAFYLLKLHGIDLDRDDAGSSKQPPPELLEQILEIREQLEQARSTNDLDWARAMARDVTAQKAAALKEAVDALDRLEQSDDPAAVQRASQALTRVRYLIRFLEEVDAMEEQAL